MFLIIQQRVLRQRVCIGEKEEEEEEEGEKREDWHFATWWGKFFHLGGVWVVSSSLMVLCNNEEIMSEKSIASLIGNKHTEYDWKVEPSLT